jgi:hypothetical protein
MKYMTVPDLVLDTAGLHLVGEDLGAGLLSLCLVDVFHKDTLVLEDVTLGLLVEGVVADSASNMDENADLE